VNALPERSGQSPDARKRQARVNAQGAENFLVASEHVAEARGACRPRFPQAPCRRCGAGAFTKRSRLKHKDGPPGSKPAQPGGSRKARKATANNGEIHMIRQSARAGRKSTVQAARPRVSFANRDIPMSFAAHSISLMQRTLAGGKRFGESPKLVCRPPGA